MPAWIGAGVDEYARRLPRHLGFQLVEITPAKGPDPQSIRCAEAQALCKSAGQARLVALDERGRGWTTEDLASQFKGWLDDGRDVAFLIGGAEGLDESLRRQASAVWSLGPLTLPHQLVRVVLAEQLYRAWTILQGHPYHRPTVRPGREGG